MNKDHFAIVIGLSSYPNLGDPPPANLSGPENDADAVAAWLADPNGGGLPPENIKKIKSIDLESPPQAAPTPSDLNDAFLWLDNLAAKNRPRKVGTRIYLYFSGHGFSPRPGSGCLLTGNAADRQYSANIWPSGWLDWLRDASYFSEYVLWMDCCMDRIVLTQPSPPPLDPLGSLVGIGKAFIAFAAPRPLKAAEKKIEEDGGKYHGVFTWNLLQALRGSAANNGGLVRSDTLANWLREAQFAWLDDVDRANPSVAKEPTIVAADAGIVFAKNVKPFDFDVTLKIPGAVADTPVFLWSGNPPTRAQNAIIIAAAGSTVALKPGLYLAEGNGLRHGFVVTRSTSIDLVEQGDPVKPSADNFIVHVIDDASADIRLCDGSFGDVMGAIAELISPPLSFGLYLIRRTTGRQITEKVILLDGDWPPAAPAVAAAVPALPPVPPITSAAPLPGTRATHEYHEVAAVQGANVTIGDGGAELMVMARWFSKSGKQLPEHVPWRGVSVIDASGKMIVNFEKDVQDSAGGDPVAVRSIGLQPGFYTLRYPAGAIGPVAQSLIIPAGWRMEVYLLHTDGESNGRPAVSLLMRKMGMVGKADDPEPWGGEGDLQLQKAIVMLADERPLVNEQLLSAAPANPLARIIGAHLLLLSVRGKPEAEQPAFDRLNKIIPELRELVGARHPDVEALSLKCSDATLRTIGPILTPPMFERSWELLLDEWRDKPDLIPVALWERVHAVAELPPYFAWADDEEVQKAYQRVLAGVIFSHRRAPAPALISGTEMALQAIQHSLGSVKSVTVESFEKLGASVGAIVRSIQGPVPMSLPRAPSVTPQTQPPDDLVAKRAEKLNLPPAAIAVLRRSAQVQSPANELPAIAMRSDGA